MERLTIDEIIAHCKRKTEKIEKLMSIADLEARDMEELFMKEYWEHRQVAEWLEQLKRYKDAEKNGLLKHLPCRVGDTVWDTDYDRTYSYEITGYSFGKAEEYIDAPITEEIVYYCADSSGSITGSFTTSDIGKTVFLTREAAEQALKQMGD